MTDSLILFALNHPSLSYHASMSLFVLFGTIVSIILVFATPYFNPRVAKHLSKCTWIVVLMSCFVLLSISIFSASQITRTLSPSEIPQIICMLSSEDQILLKNKYFPGRSEQEIARLSQALTPKEIEVLRAHEALQNSFGTIDPSVHGIGTALERIREDKQSLRDFEQAELKRTETRKSIRKALEGCGSNLPPKY